MFRTLSAALVVASTLLVPTTVPAQDLEANINLHLTLGSYSGCADPDFDVIDEGTCADLSGAAIANPVFVWVVASREGGYPDGIGGLQFGIEHSGILTGWNLCTGGSQIMGDGWPASGSGNACVWADGCYVPAGGAAARVGYFTADTGASGRYGLIADPRIGEAQWADCGAILYSICDGNLGEVDHGAGAVPEPVCGDNCDASTPTREASWGGIKGLFN